VDRPRVGEQPLPGGRELGVDAAAVVGAEDAREEPAVLEAGDEACGRGGTEGGGARELLHPHVPAVLAGECVEHRVLDDGQAVRGLERAFELCLDQPVQRGEGAPATRPDLDRVVRDSHVEHLVPV
jgi:hypothetical protein